MTHVLTCTTPLLLVFPIEQPQYDTDVSTNIKLAHTAHTANRWEYSLLLSLAPRLNIFTRSYSYQFPPRGINESMFINGFDSLLPPHPTFSICIIKIVFYNQLVLIIL